MLRKFFTGLTIAAFGCLITTPVGAVDWSGGAQGGADAARGTGQPSDIFGSNGVFQNVVNILLFAIGVLSVIMLIVGGIRYVLSGGKQESVTKAKNTILYAIVGLIVAILSFALVNFVLGIFSGGGLGIGGGTNV